VRARQTCLAGAPIVVDNATVINEVFAPHDKACGLEAIGASASAFAGFSRAKTLGDWTESPSDDPRPSEMSEFCRGF
jgi:hypothetical protein